MNHRYFSSLDWVLRNNLWLLVSSLTLIASLAWIYILSGAGMSMAPVSWTPSYAVIILAMWWVMMVAMMLPSAGPVILLAAAINSRSQASTLPYGRAGFFTAGYLLVWLVFSIIATAMQWYLQEANQLSMTLQSNNHLFSGCILLAAGLWQLSPIKQACLRHCRSPVWFLTRRRRPGNWGSLLMGAEHGSYCLGCCWFLMALLFVGGVMNLYWIAGLAIYVLMEKLLPFGAVLSNIIGWILLGWGGYYFVGAIA